MSDIRLGKVDYGSMRAWRVYHPPNADGDGSSLFRANEVRLIDGCLVFFNDVGAIHALGVGAWTEWTRE